MLSRVVIRPTKAFLRSVVGVRPVRRAQARDGGSVTILMAALIAVMLVLTAALALHAKAATQAERARMDADQAALAGAASLLGSAQSAVAPCALAAQSAQRNGARLVACQVLSTSVQVTVERPAVLGRVVLAVARAGSPEQITPGAVR